MSSELPPIPKGWILWDRKIPWESLSKENVRIAIRGCREWLPVLEYFVERPSGGFYFIIPGEDAGEALVGIECWVWGDAHQAPPVLRIISRHNDFSPFPYCTHFAGDWQHARPTYLGKPGAQKEEARVRPGYDDVCKRGGEELRRVLTITEIKLGDSCIYNGSVYRFVKSRESLRELPNEYGVDLTLEAIKAEFCEPAPKPYAFYHLGVESKLFPKGEAPAGWRRLDGREYDEKGAKL